MILALHGSGPGFHGLEFKPGLNVVLADRSPGAASKDSRNGLGKSTVIQLIHFCLGSKASKDIMPRIGPLEGWTFGLDFHVGADVCKVSRSVDNPGQVEVCLPATCNPREVKVQDWNLLLGERIFGLDPADEEAHRPTFRALISYFARRGSAAFLNPFETVQKQPAWHTQVFNAFLLGLNWRDQSRVQGLRAQGQALDELRKSGILTLIPGFQGSLGELEAEKVRREETSRRDRLALESFQVHPQYRDVEREASRLTQEIHDVGNQIYETRQMVEYYEAALREEAPAESSQVARLYEEAGVALGAAVVRTLEEAEEFYRKLVMNRRSFLSGEIERLHGEATRLELESRRLTERRAEMLSVLRTHGALEEYERLVQRLGEQDAVLRELEQRIENLKKVQGGKAELKAELALHARAARLRGEGADTGQSHRSVRSLLPGALRSTR
jgi:uncharacterized protein YydD (DUF2326 family)